MLKSRAGRWWAAAEAAGISARRAGEWLGRWRAGDRELEDRPSVARSVPGRTPAEVEEAIRALRELRFSAVRIAEALGMSERTVRAVLARHGMARLPPIDADQPKHRYERPLPGELVHIDVKKLGRIEREGHRIHGDRSRRSRGAGWEFVHVCVDDCTRLAYVEALNDERAQTVCGFLERALAWFGDHAIRVQRLMTDNGNGYRSYAHAAVCRRLGIRHLFTQPYRPKTNAKAERFIQTLAPRMRLRSGLPDQRHPTPRPARLPDPLHTTRPHQALGGIPPTKHLAERTNATAAYS